MSGLGSVQIEAVLTGVADAVRQLRDRMDVLEEELDRTVKSEELAAILAEAEKEQS